MERERERKREKEEERDRQQAHRDRGDRDREVEEREMKMSKAAMKSDLLAHQELRGGTSGGEECRADRVKGYREGGILEGNRR